MTDDELIALCAFEEATTEPDDGLAAVVRVILNRMARHYQSDGTVPGTILHGNGTAFSWAGYAMSGGKYQRVANGPDEIAVRADKLLAAAKAYKAAWARAERIAEAVQAGTYRGALFGQITPETVMYLNPAIASAAWATPDKYVCKIGHHSFYRS